MISPISAIKILVIALGFCTCIVAAGMFIDARKFCKTHSSASVAVMYGTPAMIFTIGCIFVESAVMI